MLTEDERKAAEAAYEAELRAEHERRTAALEQRKLRSENHPDSAAEEQRRIELFELKERVRNKFYRDNGYRRYTDSTGREVWLTAAEYDQRMRRRKRRGTRTNARQLTDKTRGIVIYGVMAVIAVVLGVVLAR